MPHPPSPNSRLNPEKIDLIDYAVRLLGLRSFADLGAVWLVEGGYTFQTLEKYDIDRAFLVDTNLTAQVETRALRFPKLKILRGSFGDPAIAERIGKVDAVFLFDVLLHQVKPDWDEILDLYAPNTNAFIVYNQNWILTRDTVRLIDLGEDGYFNNVPHEREYGPYSDLFTKLDVIHPDHNRAWRDIHHIWQWGITDFDLIRKMHELGFRILSMKTHGPFGHIRSFENHAFIFAR